MRLWYLLVVLGVLCCAPLSVQAQITDSLWTVNYWNGYFDSVNCVIETDDFGYLVVGTTRDVGESAGDINLIKFYRDGALEWNKKIGDTLNETGYHVIQTLDHGFLISAARDLYNRWTDIAWIIKTDVNGDTVWTYTFAPEQRFSRPLYAIQTQDSGYAITGLVNLSGLFNEAFLLKLTKDGDYDWHVHYGGDSHYQDGQFIMQLADGGYIIAGNDDNYYTTSYDFWAFRITSGGAVVWDSNYVFGDGYDMLSAACSDEKGIVMVGTTQLSGLAYMIDFDGHTIWSKSIAIYPTYESPNDIITTYDGGYMVGGWVGVTGQRRDYCFIKLDAWGDTVYSWTTGGSDDDHGQSLIQTSRGEFLLAGTSASFYNGTCSRLVLLSETVGCCGLYTGGYTGNTDCAADGKRNLGDILKLIDRVFISKLPLCCEANGDVDGDVDGKINLADVLRLIDHVYLTKAETAFCD